MAAFLPGTYEDIKRIAKLQAELENILRMRMNDFNPLPLVNTP
jgi:hypothetical protein